MKSFAAALPITTTARVFTCAFACASYFLVRGTDHQPPHMTASFNKLWILLVVVEAPGSNKTALTVSGRLVVVDFTVNLVCAVIT